MFVNKQKEIQSRISEYCRSVLECLEAFQTSVKQYCERPDRQAARLAYTEIHKAESKADDIRDEIEVAMYSKSLFPESRGDILGLLESMDKVPNQAEATVCMLWNQNVAIPPEHFALVLQLVDLSCRAGEAMVDAAEKLFSDFTNAAVAVGKIDELESEADRIEAELIEKIFSDPVDSIATILLRDFVKHIAAISDRAENAGDRIRIIVAKRTI